MNRFSFDPHRNNPIDNCSVFFFFIASWIGCPTVTLLVAPMFNKLTNLNIHEDLMCPAYNNESLLSYCFFLSGSIFHVCRSFFWKYFKGHPRKHFCYSSTLSCFLHKPHSLVHKLFSHLYLAHKVYCQMQRGFNCVKQ